MSFWRACRLWPACPETHKHLFLYVHFVFSPLATWCMHGTGNGHARQERPASSPNRPGMQSSFFKPETRMGPTSAMKALQGNGKMNKNCLFQKVWAKALCGQAWDHDHILALKSSNTWMCQCWANPWHIPQKMNHFIFQIPKGIIRTSH